MNPDRRTLYIVSGCFGAVLLLSCFMNKGDWSNLLFSLVLTGFAAAFALLVKKRKAPAIEAPQITLILLLSALAFVGLYLLTGLGFGYYKFPFAGVYWHQFILPYTLAICSAEYIRRVLLSQDIKYAGIFTYLVFLLMDITLLRSGDIFRTFTLFWDYCGLVVIPAIAANFFYNAVSKRYGCLPVIAYRVVMAVYPYVLPRKPHMPDAMLAFFTVVFPLVLLYFIQSMYARHRKAAPRRGRVWQVASTVLCGLAMTAFVMLISCRFQYGLLVIASESMTGAINKGDALVYERYDTQPLQDGQIIVFQSGNTRVVHRISRIERINGSLQIHTKGDANEAEDFGFITTSDVVGIQTTTIKYLGYPTVWMHEMFSNIF